MPPLGTKLTACEAVLQCTLLSPGTSPSPCLESHGVRELLASEGLECAEDEVEVAVRGDSRRFCARSSGTERVVCYAAVRGGPTWSS